MYSLSPASGPSLSSLTATAPMPKSPNCIPPRPAFATTNKLSPNSRATWKAPISGIARRWNKMFFSCCKTRKSAARISRPKAATPICRKSRFRRSIPTAASPGSTQKHGGSTLAGSPSLLCIFFLITFAITVSHWSEIGRDTLEFYKFNARTASDIVLLYILGTFVVAAHEYSHAHACKHVGGRVPQMGFALVFLTPAFYTDTTEGAVLGNRTQRLVISLAGIWGELMICSIATPIWWLTDPNTTVH